MVCGSKDTQINMQCGLIWEIMLYEFKLNHDFVDMTKNTSCADTDDHNTVNRWFKKFCLGCKNFNNQARSDRPKIVDSKVILQVIDANFEVRSTSHSPVWFASFTNFASCYQNIAKLLTWSSSNISLTAMCLILTAPTKLKWMSIYHKKKTPNNTRIFFLLFFSIKLTNVLTVATSSKNRSKLKLRGKLKAKKFCQQEMKMAARVISEHNSL